jgi:ABC-2 type transport system ATP-binding protein
MSSGYALEFKNITKKIGEQTILHNISFFIEKGKICGILGGTAAGKTTIYKLACNLDEPTSGQILIQSKNYANHKKELKRLIGIIPQEISFHEDLSVQDNLTFFGSLYGLKGTLLEERIEEALILTQLTTRDSFPVSQLSLSLKRRLNLACSLLHIPSLIIADEPTRGADPQNAAFILNCLKSYSKSKGATVLYTGDYSTGLENVLDNVLILFQGKFISGGTVSKLTEKMEGGIIYLFLDYASSEIFESVKQASCVKDVMMGNENSIILKTTDHKQSIASITNLLQKYSAGINEIKVLKPNLESVYRHMTWGRDLFLRQS